jgi:hypothetical protein
VQRLESVREMIEQRFAPLAIDFDSDAPPESSRDLEARSIDDAIDFVFLAVGDDALLRDSLDALGRAYVDQLYVRKIERG